MSFNPKVKDLLEDHPDKTIMGLFWSGYWRFMAVVFLVSFGIGVIASI